MTEAEQRDDFEVYASFMESLIRYFWQRDPVPNSLGITLDRSTIALIEALNSDKPLHKNFNDAAHEGAAGKPLP